MLHNVVTLNSYLLIDIIKFIYKIHPNDLFFDVLIYNFNVHMFVDFTDIRHLRKPFLRFIGQLASEDEAPDVIYVSHNQKHIHILYAF